MVYFTFLARLLSGPKALTVLGDVTKKMLIFLVILGNYFSSRTESQVKSDNCKPWEWRFSRKLFVLSNYRMYYGMGFSTDLQEMSSLSAVSRFHVFHTTELGSEGGQVEPQVKKLQSMLFLLRFSSISWIVAFHFFCKYGWSPEVWNDWFLLFYQYFHAFSGKADSLRSLSSPFQKTGSQKHRMWYEYSNYNRKMNAARV